MDSAVVEVRDGHATPPLSGTGRGLRPRGAGLDQAIFAMSAAVACRGPVDVVDVVVA
ncbi:hypothetical protein [Streptomyces albofaciens]|uniref:hypothetical protein n=1 Tax=Streptomyces albofaciens TaxID=66866 RepID=UPI00142E9FFC|nr:hypothetical protein [Streptomyces albofaciens]